MPLTGIEIYKHLPKTNCKKCGFPTCLAFAMRLAQQAVELSLCPDMSEEGKAALEAASRPPIRLVSIGTSENKVEVGNEVVLFRHEKTFYHPPGLMLRLRDSEESGTIAQKVNQLQGYGVERIGMKLTLNGFAVQNVSGGGQRFASAVGLAKRADLPLVLMSPDPDAMEAALKVAAGQRPLLYAATKDNLEKMVALAKEYRCPLAIYEPAGLSELATLSEQVSKAGVEDIVLDPGVRGFADSLAALTQIRRLALRKNFRPLGYPVITFPGEAVSSPEEEALLAGQQVAKYAGIVVLDHFDPALAYPLLTVRQNIYTDPQKPIQVTPGIYPINSPKDDSPLLITTNFSLTYFSVAGEVEASGFPSWLLVADTEGLSVLTSWAAGKFDAEKITKTVRGNEVSSSLPHRTLIIPGAVATLSGELEDELSGWKILVGPRDAVDIGNYLKRTWAPMARPSAPVAR